MKNLIRSKLVLVAVIALVLAACGGGDETTADTATASGGSDTTQASSGDDGGTDDTQAPASTEPPSADEQSDNDPPADVAGIGQATVTINDETYHFGDAGFPALQCMPDFFGVMILFLQMVDDSGNAIEGGGGLQLTLLRPGTDPVEVDQLNEMSLGIDSLDQEWIADETHPDERDIDAGMSQVDSVSFNGNTAIGTATLYEENSYWAAGGDPSAVLTATATFEATCADR